MTGDPTEGGAVGYRRPPVSTRFRKGSSGNPRGRPKNRKGRLPYDHVLGQMVTVRDGGSDKRVTAAEAFLLHLMKKGLEGDGSASRAALAALETARTNRPSAEEVEILRVILMSFGASICLGTVGFGVKLHPTDKDKVRWLLKTWIVDAALARLEERRLTLAEQRQVWDVAYRPKEVQWPAWWTYFG